VSLIGIRAMLHAVVRSMPSGGMSAPIARLSVSGHAVTICGARSAPNSMHATTAPAAPSPDRERRQRDDARGHARGAHRSAARAARGLGLLLGRRLAARLPG
jgi:hypothetical protein